MSQDEGRTVTVPWLVLVTGSYVPEQADWVGLEPESCRFKIGLHLVGWLLFFIFLSRYREVEGSFLTRRWARKELSIGLSSGVGWEFFRAE